MNEQQAADFADEILEEVSPAEIVVVATEIVRTKKSASSFRRQLKRRIERMRVLVADGDVDKAKELVQSQEVNGFWWCEGREELRVVVAKIYSTLQQNNQSDGYEFISCGDRVALMYIWVD